MSSKCQLLITLLMTASPLLLSACGGSGSIPVASAPAAGNVVQGVAASGAPLNGTLSVSDCSFPNRSTSASINQDGTFSVSIDGMSLPLLIRATGTTSSGTPITLYSFTNTAGSVNVNPLTNLLVAAATGEPDSAGLADLYANHNRASLLALASKLPNSSSDLQSALQPLSSLYDITALDPFSAPYQVNQQGLDGLLDDVDVSLANGTVTLTNNNNGMIFFSALLGNPGSGVLQSAGLPTPAQYPKPGNARLTLLLSGLPSTGGLVKHLKTMIQLPFGVTVNIDPTTGAAVVNTAIPSGGGVGAIVYPSPALSSTNNQLAIELSSLNGIGVGEFLTLRCIVSFAQLSIINASNFTVLQTQLYGDIYKQQKYKAGTVTVANLVFPVTEGNTVYNSLCASCHTLSTIDTVGKPSLLNKSALIPATFTTVHHDISLTEQQIEDLQAFLTYQ